MNAKEKLYEKIGNYFLAGYSQGYILNTLWNQRVRKGTIYYRKLYNAIEEVKKEIQMKQPNFTFGRRENASIHKTIN